MAFDFLVCGPATYGSIMSAKSEKINRLSVELQKKQTTAGWKAHLLHDSTDGCMRFWGQAASEGDFSERFYRRDLPNAPEKRISSKFSQIPCRTIALCIEKCKKALFLRNFYGNARKQGKYCGKNGGKRKSGGATTPRLRRKMLQRRLSSASGQDTACCERMRTASPVSGCVNASSAAQSCCGAMPHCAE